MPPSSGHKKYIEIDDDDDIEILPGNSVQPFRCAFCSEVLDKLSIEQRQEHYDRHLSGEKSGATPSIKSLTPENTSPSKRMWVRKPARFKKEHDQFWFPAKAEPPPPNYTPGFIPLLKRALTTSHSKGFTRRAALCYEGTVHISRDTWDTSWGCGYRNFEMVCTALMDQPYQPLYFPLLDSPIPPGVRNLQIWIENAWKEGFDLEGAQQLKKLVGTSQWIGTSDIWVAFSFRSIPAELVDFDVSSSVVKVADWVVNYFSPKDDRNISTIDDALRGASPIVSTNRMPIILQHKGHSRTIVGYEVTKKGNINLLTFDPGMIPKPNLRRLALAGPNAAEVTSSPSKSQPTSPQGLRQFFNSLPNSFHKRKGSDSSRIEKENAAKRPRSKINDDDEEVIVIEDFTDSEITSPKGKKRQHDEEDFNYSDVLKHFRIDSQKLTRKDQYQILYFPLKDPLDEKQRLSRKVVTCTKIG